jgi:glucose-6-phosphate-specific signal transduction histidine kinase
MIEAVSRLARLRDTLKASWSKLPNPSAFDNYVVGLFAVASIWVTMVVDLSRSEEPASAWIIAGTISMLSGIGWLLLARSQISRIIDLPYASAIVVGVYAIAGLIRNLTLDISCQVLGIAPPANRVLISFFSTAVLLVFANFTASRRRDAQQLQNSLLIDRQKLIWLGASYDEKVLQAQRELIRQLETELYPAIRNVLEKLTPDKSSRAPEISNDLVTTVSNVVRPICDRLSDSTDTIIEQLDSIAGRPFEALKPQARFSIRRALRPSRTVAILLFVAISISPALGDDSNFASFAMLSLAAWVIAITTRLVWPKRFDQVSAGAGLSLVSAIYAVAFLISVFVIRGFGATDQTLFVQASFAIGGAIILARLSFISQSRIAVEQELKEENEKLSQLISQLRRQIWLIRRNAAWVLHGPIQSALISSAMSLANEDLSGPERTIIARRIEEAVGSLEANESMKPQLDAALKSIANVWSRSCEVEWRVDDALLKSLASDSDTTTCLIEIASEGVSNAIRHGMAKHVIVSISELSPIKLQLDVRDDGDGLATNTQPGLGSAMLDQICLKWSRERVDDETLLTAEVMRNSEFTPR